MQNGTGNGTGRCQHSMPYVAALGRIVGTALAIRGRTVLTHNAGVAGSSPAPAIAEPITYGWLAHVVSRCGTVNGTGRGRFLILNVADPFPFIAILLTRHGGLDRLSKPMSGNEVAVRLNLVTKRHALRSLRYRQNTFLHSCRWSDQSRCARRICAANESRS